MLYTDLYNARRFAEMFKNDLRWSRDYGGWFIWNGKLWERDNNNAIRKFPVQVYDELKRQLEEWTGDNTSQELFARHVKSTGSEGKMNAMSNTAQAFLGAQAAEFDAETELFNCTNGTYNLSTHEFQSHDPNDMLSKMSGVKYDYEAKCPMWFKFLDDIFIGNEDIIEFIQRAIGYSLTTSTKEHCMFIFYGTGANGKSRFIDTIVSMLGDYALNCPSSTFIKKQATGIPNDIARLKGARMVTAIESNQNVSLDEMVIKQVTSEDKITARFLNKEFFDFVPTFKVYFATNHKPNIHGTDNGIWRRIRMIPFEFRVTQQNEDKFLGEKLKKEMAGIFNWAIEGVKKWQRNGLQTPQVILDATGTYQDEEDDIGNFIKDYCIEDPRGFIPSIEFKRRFKEVSGYNKGGKQISEYMLRHGIENGRQSVGGVQSRGWIGIRFPKAFEQSTF